MADRNPIYSCPCCQGQFTIVEGKLIAVSTRSGEYTEVRGDGVIIEHHTSAPGRSAGLQVETVMNAPKQPANVRQKPKREQLKPLGPTQAFRPKGGTKCVSIDGLEINGDSASGDFLPEYADMTPMERHADRLMQAAFEADLSQRGMNSTIL